MRLINANEAKKLYKEQCVGDCGCCSDLQDDNTCTLIDRVPTVDDAVIVTRCKNCKHLGRELINGCFSCAAFELPYCRPDDYCSKGIPHERAAV